MGRLARELFYPVCVAGRPSDAYGSAKFAAANGVQLLSPVPLLTRNFIHARSREKWDFTNRSTI